MFTFAHISDLHIPPLPATAPWALVNKRLLGYLSWHYKRKAQHLGDVLTALRDDLKAQAPDHVCVTGDLTNLALPAEFKAAAEWLAGLGAPTDISVVPGNHDAYVHTSPADTLERWRPWMRGDDGEAAFPYVRRRGPVGFVGVSSAVACAPFFAIGRVGPVQRARLAETLVELRREGRLRVVLIHHPPQTGAVRRQRRLSDAEALRRLLAEAGAELVLHGHVHRPLDAALPGVDGPIPVLGAASGSAVGAHGRSVAHYHLLRVEDAGGIRRLAVEHRHFVPAAGHFVGTQGATYFSSARVRGNLPGVFNLS